MPLSIELHDSPTQNRQPALARMVFGTSMADAVTHPGLHPLAHDTAYENWFTKAPLLSGRNGSVTWHTDNHVLFGHAAVELGNDASTVTYNLYDEIFNCIRAHGFPHLLRIWHYLPRINDGAGDREQYKRFCQGRARAFDRWLNASSRLPAGTAIGSRCGNTLQIYFLSARIPGQQVENPRQVSAFEYPRRYGPRRPQFSRAMIWRQDNAARLLVSGTASIVGHETRHAGDVQGQLSETWRNLACLRDRSGAGRPLALRVYVRHTADYPVIRQFIDSHLDDDVAVIYLHADICRAELLVEIEGVYDIPNGAAQYGHTASNEGIQE